MNLGILDQSNLRDKIAEMLRFSTWKSDSERVCLEDYAYLKLVNMFEQCKDSGLFWEVILISDADKTVLGVMVGQIRWTQAANAEHERGGGGGDD